MNILLIGGPQDGTVMPAALDENGMPAEMITAMSESSYELLRAGTQDVNAEPLVEYNSVYEPAGITDEGNLAFFFHDPHPGCPRYEVRLELPDD